MKIMRTITDWYTAKDELAKFAEGKSTGLKPAVVAVAKMAIIAYLVYFLIKSALSLIPTLIIIGLALSFLRGQSR